MRFENIAILYLLVLPLIAAIILLTGIWARRRLLKRFGQKVTLDAQLVRPSPYLRAAKGITLVLGVSGLILAAARPQYGGRIRMLKKRGIDVVVALDFSKSMLAQDIQPSRLARAKLELNDFIGQLTGDRIGLVAFAGDTMKFPVTTDYAAAIAFWKNLNPYDMPIGGTAIGKAITAAHRMLIPEHSGDDEAGRGRSKAILLLTDGEDHFGDPVEAAKEAAKDGIVIHVVGIGSDSPELIPRYLDDGTTMGYQKTKDGEYVTTALTEKNEETLREIASVTGGRYFRAGSDLKGMTAVVQEIRKMKQSDIESRQQEVYEDVFQWFLIPSFALLSLAFLIPERFARLRRGGSRRLSAGAVSSVVLLLALTGAGPAAAWEPFVSENGDVADGNALLKEGKAGEALKAYESAARALPNRGAVHLNRGLALERMGEKELDQAMQAFKLATETKGSDEVRARAHFNLGNAFYKKEDYQEAVRQYKKSLLLAPGNKDVAWNLELAQQKQKEKEEQQKKDQEQQNQDQQNQDQQNQDQQNQDQQNQDQQNQDQQNQDQQNQDQQNQDQKDPDKKDQDQQNQDKQDDQQKKDQQQQQQQQQQQPKTRQEMEQLLDNMDKQPDNLQKQMAKQRGVAVPNSRLKDW